jgi:hypothetical protein
VALARAAPPRRAPALTRRMRRRRKDVADAASCSKLSSAFAMASCMSNRIVSSRLAPSLPRVLAITANTDFSAQYIAMMNCIFSFQKHSVLVDSLVLSTQDCGLLQQACPCPRSPAPRPPRTSAGGTRSPGAGGPRAARTVKSITGAARTKVNHGRRADQSHSRAPRGPGRRQT